jgi:hypothetical protein
VPDVVMNAATTEIIVLCDVKLRSLVDIYRLKMDATGSSETSLN